MTKYLHITDYDNTISPGKESEYFKDKDNHFKTYRDFIKNNPEIEVVYSSGRTVSDIMKVVKENDLPTPRYIIGSVGAEIYDTENKTYIKEWLDKLATVRWDHKKVREVINYIELQEERYQCDFKVSYYFDNASKQDLKKIKDTLKQQGIDANLVYSSNRYLDIVPEVANKGKAGVFMAKYLKLPMTNVVISGDSLNDIDMFKEDFGFKIAPKNSETGLLDGIKGLKNIYIAKKGVALGTVEGLNEFLKKQGK